jgi:hypothetical protein
LRLILLTILFITLSAVNISAQPDSVFFAKKTLVPDSTLGDINPDTLILMPSSSSNTAASAAAYVAPPATIPVVQPKKPEIFNSGFIDFQSSGQMNASARVFKLYIGEPKKFMLPVSVYSGVSGNSLNGGSVAVKGSEQMILGLINPMSGMFNISIDNTIGLGKQKKDITGASFVYQAVEKLLSGQQAVSLKTFTFFSTYANTGLLLQTGAWERDKEKNMGVFWLLFRMHVVQTSNSFQKLSGYPPDNEFFKGYSIGIGIEINNVLNIKSYYYRYINPGADLFEIPI